MYKPYTYIKVQICMTRVRVPLYREPLEGITFQDVHHEKAGENSSEIYYIPIWVCAVWKVPSLLLEKPGIVKCENKCYQDSYKFHSSFLWHIWYPIHPCTKCNVYHIILLVKMSAPSRSVLSVKVSDFTCTNILSMKSHTTRLAPIIPP